MHESSLQCWLKILFCMVYVVISLCLCVCMSVAQCGSEIIFFNNSWLDILRRGLLQNPEFTILAVLASHLLTGLKTGHKIHLVFAWVLNHYASMTGTCRQLTTVWKLWLGEIWYLFWLLCIPAHTRYTYERSDTSTYTCKKTFFKNGKIFSNFNLLNWHTQYQKIKQDNHIYRTRQEGVKVNWGCRGGPFLGMTGVPLCRKRLGQKHQRRWHEGKSRRKNPEEPGSADLWPETPHLYNRRNKCLSFLPFSGASLL